MKSAARRESQNRVTEAARRLMGALELKLPATISSVDVSFYRSNLANLERRIEEGRSCGDKGSYITRLLGQLQPVLDQLFDCQIRLIERERAKINHRKELILALKEYSEALESTGLAKISSLGDRLTLTFTGFIWCKWLLFIGKDIKAKYLLSENYSLESLARLFLQAQEKIEEQL